MKQLLTLLTLCAALTAIAPNSYAADKAGKSTSHPQVILHTSKGPITIELYPDKAPVTVANFLKYAKSGFYNGTIFHRVIKRFMIQAGGFTKDMHKKPTGDPIVNESGNGLHNDRYTVAMARTGDPDSATSQFFINTRMNGSLDALGTRPGYAVFGAVVDGQYVVSAIDKVKTHRVGQYNDVPIKPVLIESVEVKSAGK